MSDYVIEKDIPIPIDNLSKVWPFIQMKVGDSFIVKTSKERVAAISFIRMKKKRTKHKDFYSEIQIISRKQEDGTYRIWRIF